MSQAPPRGYEGKIKDMKKLFKGGKTTKDYSGKYCIVRIMSSTTTKWDYIKLISERGNRYGYSGGVADLLDRYNKANTREITLSEAREFYKMVDK